MTHLDIIPDGTCKKDWHLPNVANILPQPSNIHIINIFTVDLNRAWINSIEA